MGQRDKDGGVGRGRAGVGSVVTYGRRAGRGEGLRVGLAGGRGGGRTGGAGSTTDKEVKEGLTSKSMAKIGSGNIGDVASELNNVTCSGRYRPPLMRNLVGSRDQEIQLA
jgi:hypothetical protein